MDPPIDSSRREKFVKKHRDWIIKALKHDFSVTKKSRSLKWTRRGFLLAIPSYIAWLWYHHGKLTDDNGQKLNFEKLRNKDFEKASYTYDINGRHMGRFFYEARDYVTFKEIPDLVKKAFIAAEDGNFYRYRIWGKNFNFGHPGVDPLAVIRAGIGNIINLLYKPWGIKSGGSTIDIQLVRRLYENDVSDFKNRTHSLPRKIREARIAVALNNLYSKDEILEVFLNLPYFGHGANGVAEAWRVYFNKDLRCDPITIREAAMIAALNKSPMKFCPIYHKPYQPVIPPETDEETRLKIQQKYEVQDVREKIRFLKTRDRANYVIQRMYEEGFIGLDDFEKEKFKDEEPFGLNLIQFTPITERRFVYANRMIKEFLMFSGITDQEITRSGGLKVKSTIDLDIQKIVTEEVNKQLYELNNELPESDPLEASFVVMDVHTGELRAVSGGHEDISQMQYNRLLARRSPGSAIKPFVYATALENGMIFDSLICNCPISMRGANGKIWAPKNFREDKPVPTGRIPLPIGFIRSVNLPTIQMLRTLEDGEEKFVELANRCGIWGQPNVLKDSKGEIWFKYYSSRENRVANNDEGSLLPQLTSVIGGFGVSLIELAAGYRTFASNGMYIRPSLIKEVKDYSGNIKHRLENPEENKAILEETARNITILGRAVTEFGTLKISMRGIEQKVAGKTGTSNSAGINIYGQPSEGPADAMVATWNPEYVILIRFGHDKLRSIEVPIYMSKVSGRTNMQVSAGWLVGPAMRRIWDRIYGSRPNNESPEKVYLNKPKVEFPEIVEAGTAELIEKYSKKYQ